MVPANYEFPKTSNRRALVAINLDVVYDFWPQHICEPNATRHQHQIDGGRVERTLAVNATRARGPHGCVELVSPAKAPSTIVASALGRVGRQ